MPTLENSSVGQRSEIFTCPSNKGVTINVSCPINTCPYHTSRLGYLFDVIATTKCGLHEPELQSGPTLATLQKSNVKKVSATTLRTTYNQGMDNVKSKIKLVNEVPDAGYCQQCGSLHCNYPNPDDYKACREDKRWSNEVLKYYGLVPNAFRRALVWKLLGENNLFIPKKLSDRK